MALWRPKGTANRDGLGARSGGWRRSSRGSVSARAVARRGAERTTHLESGGPGLVAAGVPRRLCRRARASDGPRALAGGDDGLRGGECRLAWDGGLGARASQVATEGSRRDRAGRSGEEDRGGQTAVRAAARRRGSVAAQWGPAHQSGADDRRLRRDPGRARGRRTDRAGVGGGAARRRRDRPGPRRAAAARNEEAAPGASRLGDATDAGSRSAAAWRRSCCPS